MRGRSNTSSIFRESLDHPTDTLLPGSKLRVNKVIGISQQLISWKNSEDPAPGVFSFGLNPNGSNQFFLEWNRSQIYWSSEVWNGKSFGLIRNRNFIFNYTFVSSKNESERYFTYYPCNPSNLAKYQLDQTGQLKAYLMSGVSVWNTLWTAPTNRSDVYALCIWRVP